LRAHLPDRSGRNAHDQPTGRHGFAGRHDRARRNLSAVPDHRSGEDYRSHPDPDVIADPAGVYDGAVARLYVNGAEVASEPQTGTFLSDTTPVILGGNGNDGSNVPTELFPGRIDELMLFARALSPTEIAQLAAGAAF